MLFSAPLSEVNMNQVIEDLRVIYNFRTLLKGIKRVFY